MSAAAVGEQAAPARVPTPAVDATTTPFRMPFALVRGQARTERPLRLAKHAGASLATTLRGSYDAALLRAGCVRPDGPRCCDRTPVAIPQGVCRHRQACPVPALYKPRSEPQRRDHPSPISLWVCQVADERLEFTLALFGRRALAARELVFGALVGAGQAGLWDGRQAIRFDVAYQPVFEGTLGAWAGRNAVAVLAAGRVLVEFASPCHGDDVRLGHVLGNVAHDLVQWDLEDARESVTLGKRGCDDLADAARREAQAALAEVSVQARQLDAEDQGPRQSRSNRGVFRLHGVSGFVEASGDLRRAWPWLAALALRGAGQKRSFGLGEVRLWWPAASEPSRG